MTAKFEQLLEHFLKQAAEIPSDRPTQPMQPISSKELVFGLPPEIKSPTQKDKGVSLPPPPKTPGQTDKEKGARWMAEKILNSHIVRKLQQHGKLTPEEVGELLSILHSRPKQ